MTREIAVSPLQAVDPSGCQYDAFIAVAGYERRARFISETIIPPAQRHIALGFPDQRVLSFEKNRKWYLRHDFEFLEPGDEEFSGVIKALLEKTCAIERCVSLSIDISSLSRLRMAHILAAIVQLQNTYEVSVDFLYAVAKYSAPVDKSEPISFSDTVLPFFAGWSPRLELPTVAVIGLGYEPDKAVGAYEYLEATKVWAFVPSGEDARYDKAVKNANAYLLKRLSSDQIIPYQVDQPFSSFQNLESLAFGAKKSGRVVLVPFGPKIFALACLLVACIHRDVAVWRISAGKFGEPVDRRASGKVVGIRVVLPPASISPNAS
jgi:hypothetical protein